VIGTVPLALGRARRTVAPKLDRQLELLSPEVRRVCRYHFGFADELGRTRDGDGGKAVRPALALLSAEAAGSPAETALPGAVAVELVHNFSLLHDDVMDRDGERRHRATAWAVFGEGSAILAGDALLVLAQRALLAITTPPRLAAWESLSRATARMIDGQAEDMAFQSRSSVSVGECLAMMAHKTGALLSCAASIGAILASAPGPIVDALADFGLHLGLAFQAIDDVMGIWGDPHMTGKPAAGDLRERKKSLPVAAALQVGGPDGFRLQQILEGGEPAGPALAEAVALVERLGGGRRARDVAERGLERCFQALGRVALCEPARTELEEMARFVAGRKY